MIRTAVRVLGAALACVLLSASPALAHVEIEDSAVDPSGATTVTFSFHHGCDGAPTTSLRVQIPAEVTDPVPQPVDGWQTAVTPTELSWTGGSVPDGDEGTFTATMQVSGAAGTTIWFPVIQGCPGAEETWIETAAPGAPEPEHVAPSIVLTQTIEPPSTAEPPTTAAASTEAPGTTRTTLVPGEAAITQEGSPTNNAGLVVGLIAVGAIVVGAAVLYLRYRGRGNTNAHR